MRTQSQVIICDDEPLMLNKLAYTAKKHNLDPVTFSSSAECYAWLQTQNLEAHPLWAVFDLDMRYAKEQNPSTLDCLNLMHKKYPDVSVIVYSGALDQAHNRVAVIKAHPRVWLHDKNDGPDELFHRLNSMMTKQVGNLVLENGFCLHQTTNKVFEHPAIIKLIINYPSPAKAYTLSEVRAIQRFHHWLMENEPQLDIFSNGNQNYSIRVRS